MNANANANETEKPQPENAVRDVPFTSDDADVVGEEVIDEADDEAMPEAEGTDPPEWVILPPNLKMPVGRQVTFVQFRAKMTDVPSKGDRQCIMWNLTEADEKLALKRTRGEALRTIDELAKQMIRAVDGKKADWTGAQGPASVDLFWRDVGGKCRQQLKNIYAKAHTFNPEEAIDFFSNCVAVRTAAS